MTTRLVAFAGLAGCGKSTAASHLVDRFGFVRMSFAQPIRDMLRAGFGVTPEELADPVLKETPNAALGGRTPRYAMQTLGTEWGRSLMCASLWIDTVSRRVEAARQAGRSVVFDDCRFENEAKAIRALGGTLVGIDRPGLVQGGHASEAGVPRDLIDVLIHNTGDKRALEDWVATVCCGVV